MDATAPRPSLELSAVEHIKSGQKGAINVLKFNEDADCLASGGDGGCVEIFSRKFYQRISARQAKVVDLIWYQPPQQDDLTFLVSAGSNGTIKAWRQQGEKSKDFIPAGSRTVMPDHAIEGMAIYHNVIAVVGRGGLFMYRVAAEDKGEWDRISSTLELIDLQRTSWFVVTLHWRNWMKNAMFISAWDLPSWKRLFKTRIDTRIANIAWSEEERIIAVWNLENGVDLYRLDDQPGAQPSYLSRIVVRIRKNYPIQLQFLPDGPLVVGSDRGVVRVYNIVNKTAKKVFYHDTSQTKLVQTVATADADENNHYLIASATSEGTVSSIVVWAPGKAMTRIIPKLRHSILLIWLHRIRSYAIGLLCVLICGTGIWGSLLFLQRRRHDELRRVDELRQALLENRRVIVETRDVFRKYPLVELMNFDFAGPHIAEAVEALDMEGVGRGVEGVGRGAKGVGRGVEGAGRGAEDAPIEVGVDDQVISVCGQGSLTCPTATSSLGDLE
ncbi:hypothetical protein D9611_014310 [Ephemerocybe angulata]|uniref:Uncharacterized protein n=1 Tax=Ephemerocybe angulata TaxID=980116 RepID=A0A8H5FAD6_9AGAR|nr:hypothetical protein D9611_014310 [Tulosesus angulatus]